MLRAAMPPWGAAGYMEGMLVVMKSAICCRASRLVGVLPVFIWSWIMVSSSSQNACRPGDQKDGSQAQAQAVVVVVVVSLANIQACAKKSVLTERHARTESQLQCGLSVLPCSTHAYTGYPWISCLFHSI